MEGPKAVAAVTGGPGFHYIPDWFDKMAMEARALACQPEAPAAAATEQQQQQNDAATSNNKILFPPSKDEKQLGNDVVNERKVDVEVEEERQGTCE